MPADITVNNEPYLYEVSTSQVQIALNPNRYYTVYHTGKDSAGAASTGDVFGETKGTTVTTTYANQEGKLVFQNGTSVPVRAGASNLYAKTSSGSVSLLIVPSEYLHRPDG